MARAQRPPTRLCFDGGTNRLTLKARYAETIEATGAVLSPDAACNPAGAAFAAVLRNWETLAARLVPRPRRYDRQVSTAFFDMLAADDTPDRNRDASRAPVSPDGARSRH